MVKGGIETAWYCCRATFRIYACRRSISNILTFRLDCRHYRRVKAAFVQAAGDFLGVGFLVKQGVDGRAAAGNPHVVGPGLNHRLAVIVQARKALVGHSLKAVEKE